MAGTGRENQETKKKLNGIMQYFSEGEPGNDIA